MGIPWDSLVALGLVPLAAALGWQAGRRKAGPGLPPAVPVPDGPSQGAGGEGTRALLNERLRMATRAAHLGIWEWVRVGDRLIWDDLMREVHGMAVDEAPLSFEAWMARVEPEDQAVLRQALAAAQRDDVPLDVVVRVRRRSDGALRHLRLVGQVLRDGEGRAQRVLGTAQDVTKRFQAQAALAESERRFHGLFSAMTEGVALHELVRDGEGQAVDYRILEVNPAFEVHTGIPVERARGALGSVVYGSTSPPYLHAFARVVASGLAASFDTEVPALGRHFHFTALPMGPDAFATVFEDITARTLGEVRLRRSEQTYRAMAENLPGGALVIFDRELRYLAVDGQGLAAVGLSKAGLEGRTVREAFPPEVAEGIEAHYREVLAGHPAVREMAFRGRTYLTRGVPLPGPDGAVERGMVLTTDITERLQMEEALRASEDRFRTVAEQTGQIIYEVDLAAGKVRLAGAVRALGGYDPTEIADLDLAGWEALIHEEDRPLASASLQDAEASGQPFLVEYRFRRKDGSWFDAEDSGIVQATPDGGRRILGTLKDVTARHAVERALHEAAEQLHTLVATTTDGVWVTDLEGRLLEVNDAYTRISGYGAHELLGMCVRDLEGLENPADTAEHLQRLRELGHERFETLHRRKDGTTLEVEVSVTFVPTLQRLVAFVRDISRRKAAERALKVSEDRYRSLVDNLHEGLGVVDAQGTFAFCNARICELLGAPESEVIGQPATRWLEGESLARFRAGLSRRREGQVDRYELQVRRADGQVIDILLSASPLQDEQGAFVGSMALIQDITERKRAEAEVLRLSQFLEGVIEHADVWLNVLDPQARVVLWNHAAEVISGYPREEVLGQAEIWAWLYPEEAYRAEIAGRAGAILARGEVVRDFETTIRAKDGTPRTILWDSRPLRDGTGAITGSLALGRDVTASKRAAEALRVSEERYRIVAEQTGQLLYDVDLATGSIAWSGAISALTGFEAEAFGAFGLAEWEALLHPEDRQAAIAELERCVETLEPYGVGYRMRRADGSYFDVADRGVFLAAPDGRAGRMLGVLEDVTARVQAEAAVREAEARLRRIANSVPVMVYQLHCRSESDWRFDFVNERVREYYRVTPEVALTDLRHTLGRVHPEDRDRVMAGSAEAFRTLTPWTAEFRVQFEGETRWQLGASVPERQSDGSVLFTGFFQDITERKAAEAERERLLGELGQKNKELETLVYVASHDLRSPLVNVLGFSQRLEKAVAEALAKVRTAEDLGVLQTSLEPVLAERMPTALRFIKASGTKMDALIGGLLKVSRAGRVELKPEVLDLHAMLRGLLDAMAFQIQQAGAFVELGPLPSCVGDAGQVGQVLSNLLDNALKYRDPTRPLRISVTGREEGPMAILEVADTGIGIEPESQDKVFGLFHRLDPDGAVPGEGLGLTLVQRMVERNGGRVWLTSEPGAGSHFFITLPRP